MAKQIVPHKLIIDLDKDGTFRSGILQYRVMHRGAMANKFYTMGIAGGISLPSINTLLGKVKDHVEKGEKIKKPKD